jgi:uncharacterized metal-binding protein
VPSGRVHLQLDFLLLLILAGAAYFLRTSLEHLVGEDSLLRCATAFLISYAFSSFSLSPDLDLTTSRPARHWGPLRWIWVPYARLFRHRGISHTPLIGTFLRVVYLCAFLLLIAWTLGSHPGLPQGLSGWQSAAEKVFLSDRGLLVSTVAGLLLPDLNHVAADRLWRV